MSMTAGSVALTSLDGSGNPTTRTGTGAAVVIFDALVAAKAAGSNPVPMAAPTVGSTTAPYSAARPATASDVAMVNAGRLNYFQDLATTVNGIVALVTYIQANAAVNLSGAGVTVTPSLSLGRLPSSGTYAANAPIQGPSTGVSLPLAPTTTNIL